MDFQICKTISHPRKNLNAHEARGKKNKQKKIYIYMAHYF